LPTAKDVLTGTGKPIQQHPGNVELRVLVASHLDEYMRTKSELRSIVEKVYDMVKSSTGRFLCQDDDGWWREISEVLAKEKVSAAFMTASWKLKKASLSSKRKDENDSRRSVSRGMTDMESCDSSLFLPEGKKPRCDSMFCCRRSG